MPNIKGKRLALLISALLFGILCLVNAQVKPRKLAVQNIAGYYVTDDQRAANQELYLAYLRKSPRNDTAEQGDFTGKYGDSPIVGQGYLSGGTDDGRLPDDVVRFDFMYAEPQDDTAFMHSSSIMSRGNVVGLLINEAGTSKDGQQSVAVRYRRVSHAQFVAFERTHPR